MYRMKSQPDIVVEKIGEGFHRLGAKVKFHATSYRDKDGHLDSRRTEEFNRMFERCE